MKLSAASDAEVTVDYATSNGTAESGTDFRAASGTLTFAARATSATVRVATTGDSADETFTLELSNPVGVELGDAVAIGTIEDDDGRNPSVTDVAMMVAFVPSASHDRAQGFVRLVNHSGEAGTVSIVAIDDAGMEYGPVKLDLEAHHTMHLNSDDLEQGNAGKGLADGTGLGEGSWRLVLTSALDLEVLSYVRADDGFVTSMHEVAPSNEAGHRVVFFNPGSNLNQVSWLRLVNPGAAPVDVTITGTDDAGAAGAGAVELTLGAGASRSVTAQALESGADLPGRLGDGKGKWRLDVSAEQPLRVMSLLSSPEHLTNLSAAPGRP